jgi:hypothetical protein
MIRLRRKDKSTITLPKDIIFIEFVNDDGEVLQVFSENQDMKSFNTFGYPSDKADKYEKYFGVKFVKQIYDLDYDKILIKTDQNN